MKSRVAIFRKKKVFSLWKWDVVAEFCCRGSRRGEPLKSRAATFEVFWLWEWDVVAGVFAVEGSRRGKPLKIRVANFSKKKEFYFWAFLLWEETGHVWDVVAGVLL